MSVYHIFDKEEQKGPYALDQIVSMWRQGQLTAASQYYDEAAANWKPVSALINAAPAPAALPPPPTHILFEKVSKGYRKLSVASVVLQLLVCAVALIPFLGFFSWIIVGPCLVATLVTSIIILSRGGTVPGLIILLTTIFVVLPFVLAAPFITSTLFTVGAVSVADAHSKTASQTTASERSSIEGGFGKKFGEVFMPPAEDSTGLCEFQPRQPFRSFDQYRVMVTPVTHRIYHISAQARLENYEAALKEKQVLLALLQGQYGETFENNRGDYKLTRNGRTIRIEEGSGLGAGSKVEINFSDESLYKEGEAERAAAAKTESKAADAGSLFATNEPVRADKPAPPEPAEDAVTPERAPTRAGERHTVARSTGDVLAQAHADLEAAIARSREVDQSNLARPAVPVEPPTPTPRREPEKTWDKPHVYIQICEESQRPTANLIKKQLQTNGAVVMDVDNVHDHPSMPVGASEVRYVTSDDSEEVQEVAATVRQFMFGNEVTTATPAPGTPYVSHSRQYEIWLSKSFRPTPLVSRLDPALVNRWSTAQIQTAIDEIYARRGANFPRKKDQEWAEKQSWYHAVPGLTHDAAEQLFTKEERADIELLAARRAAISGTRP